MLAAGHCVGRVPPCFLHLGMTWAPSALDESNPVCPCVRRQYQVDSVGPVSHWFSCFSRHLIMARTLQHPLTPSNQIKNNHQILCDPRQGKRRQLSEKGSDYLIQAVTTQMSKLDSSRRSSPVIRRCLGRASLDSPKSHPIPRYPKISQVDHGWSWMIMDDDLRSGYRSWSNLRQCGLANLDRCSRVGLGTQHSWFSRWGLVLGFQDVPRCSTIQLHLITSNYNVLVSGHLSNVQHQIIRVELSLRVQCHIQLFEICSWCAHWERKWVKIGF